MVHYHKRSMSGMLAYGLSRLVFVHHYPSHSTQLILMVSTTLDSLPQGRWAERPSRPSHMGRQWLGCVRIFLWWTHELFGYVAHVSGSWHILMWLPEHNNAYVWMSTLWYNIYVYLSTQPTSRRLLEDPREWLEKSFFCSRDGFPSTDANIVSSPVIQV